MARTQELALSLKAAGAIPKASEKAWISLANEFEAELKPGTKARGAQWIHASERCPSRAGQYFTISFDSKSDSRLFGVAVFDGRVFHTLHTFVVAYWLDQLDLPHVLDHAVPALASSAIAVPMEGATRVERFVASLPAYRTGPKMRVRFLEAFAEFLEIELEAPDIQPTPRWIKASERLPATTGRRAIVAKDPDGVFLATVPFEGVFMSQVEGRKVLFWLDGLRCPPFYYQPSKGLQVVPPHPRHVAPQDWK